jgi:hypothetical protein
MSLSGCREIEEVLFDYLEENLDNRIKAAVEEHLASCEACRTELERCRSTLAMLASAKVMPPRDFTASVLAKIEAEQDAGTRSETDKSAKTAKILTPKRPFRFRYGTVAAALFLVVALAAGWRVLPALMNTNTAKDNSSVQYNDSELSSSGLIESKTNNNNSGDITSGDGSDTYADDTQRMLMFAAPSAPAQNNDSAADATGSADISSDSGAGDNSVGAETEAPAETDLNENSSTEKYGITAVTTPDQYITQYAPNFEGLATEVVIIYTNSPIYDRPYASARVDGDGYTAYLINDSVEAVAAAETLAVNLSAEVYGATGSGLVWIEIYN